jgi:glycosyltransferase involved in cell wall biosynthesis
MTKIIIDPQIFILQDFGGISRYFIELCNQFEQTNKIKVILPILYTDNLYYKDSRYFQESFQNKNHLLIRFSKIFRPFIPRKLKRKSINRTADLLDNQKFDLFIPTYYDPYFLTHLKNKPFVLTVHDMIHELYPQYFDDADIVIKSKSALIARATKIIAVSENTKKDLLNIYPNVDPKKVEVIYLAHTINDGSSVKIKNIPEQYILFVGKRDVYKNFFFFLEAVTPILKEKPDLYVFCAGGNPFTKEELIIINNLGIAKQLLQKNFYDIELTAYYKNALCFVFPSEYEGFGIPILESMASGCPVVLTNYSSFPEIAGDAGIYFELNNKTDLRNKVISAISDSTFRQSHIFKGITQASKFSWKKTAEATLNVYQMAL